MPDYVDVVRLDVRAERRPTLSVPNLVSVYEGQTVSFDITVNTGYPVLDDLRHQLLDSQGVVTEGGSNPDVQYTEPNWDNQNANTVVTIPISVVAPTLPGDSPTFVDWFIDFDIIAGSFAFQASTRVRVYQSVTASISFPENLSAYELTDFSNSELMYNAGSPVATQIRHSFHSSLSNARSGSNPITSNRPGVSINPTTQELANLAGQAIRNRSGTLRYNTALPSVSSDTRWYGRLEIVQNGVVVDSTAYTLTILNAVQPSISVVNGIGVEGTRAVFPMLYTSGAPFADRFNLVGFYNTQQDAQNNRNRLTSADGIPSNVLWGPTTPAHSTGQQSGALYMDLPYVSADKTIWALARLERDTGEGSSEFFQTTFYITIQNRVPAQIDVQEYISMDEDSTTMIMFTYTRGVPAARGYGVSIHESESDANNNRNPVMDSDDPRITLSAYDNTGSQTAQKTGTATIVAPDIGDNDRSWYPRFYMDQDIITPDP
ncbi:MAG: hypothetical protein F4036_00015 [Gammaproteobacteria bacterium]|nr:hypothetical protein [Gammaproteobacteria bacterium]